MERLSDIMRTTQGPHVAAKQRLPQQEYSQGLRQSPQTRRPLPEQSGRSRISPRVSGFPSTRPTLPSRYSQDEEEQWEESEHPISRTNYDSRYTPRASRYTEQPPQGDYYAEEEEYSMMIPIDSQEEWSDDTAVMRYGDWESEPGYPHESSYQEEEEYQPPVPQRKNTAPVPRTPTREIGPDAQPRAQMYRRNNPLVTRDLARATSENTRPSSPSRVREDRQLVPTLPARLTQQRATQPLRSRQIAQVREEMQPGALVRASQEETEETTIYVPAPYKNPTPVCPICKGAGYLRQDVPYGHPGFGKPVQCKCKQKDLQAKRWQQRRENANLDNLSDKGFDNFLLYNGAPAQLHEAFQEAREYAHSPHGWLVFAGKSGCGKTHLAAAIANHYLATTGETVLFITASDLLDHLRATFSPSSDIVYDKLFEQVREVSLLVLDDLGAQKGTPWANEKLFQLINYRYNYRIPTVITTNWTSSQNYKLVEIDERIRSRLSDLGLVITLELDRVGDYRLRNPRRNQNSHHF
ncbi:MAG TPA: ATP-binding protein [Ktedonobacteraceae bacterium]|nr:ATP-binding protein [Ktedonobacteraceae bacterium]